MRLQGGLWTALFGDTARVMDAGHKKKHEEASEEEAVALIEVVATGVEDKEWPMACIHMMLDDDKVQSCL